MRFKREENDLMWESFVAHRSGHSLGAGDGDDEMVLEIEPGGEIEVEPESEDHDEHEAHDEHEPSGGVDSVLLTDLKKLAEYSQKLLDAVQCDCEMETWMMAKLIKASDYVSDVWHSLDAKADFANDGYEQSDNLSL